MSLGGGDKLARGFSSAQFGPNTTVSDEKWKEAFGEEGMRKLNAMDEKDREKLIEEAKAVVEAEAEKQEIVKDPTVLPIPFRAVQDRIIVSRVEEEEKVGTFYVPDESKEKPAEGIVVAVGPGKYVNGELQKSTIVVGERVVFGKFSGAEVKIGFEQYLVLREEDIFLVKEVVF